MHYTIEAKPTTYKGVQFRSRLEARWAAFFDSYEFQWVYEPVDLGGRSPDFLLCHAFNDLVEVKPIICFDEDTATKMFRHATGGMILCGLTPSHCWINYKGWWEEFAFVDSVSHWNAAGNIVQWFRK